MKSYEELTAGTGVTAWVPADSYADLIFEAAVCHSQLSGKVTAIDYDMQKGQGETIQVRYAPSRTAQGPMDACECLSATSSTLGTHSITIQQYGDYDVMCDFSLFTAKGPVKASILKEMGKGLANAWDQEIWNQLIWPTGATGGGAATYATLRADCNSMSTLTNYCCEFATDVYNKIINVQKYLQSTAYHPDTVVMNPIIARWLYYKDAGSYPAVQAITPLLKFDNNAQLISIAGMNVIESCVASGCTASGATLIAVFDSSRAVGEAWGKRPTFYEHFEVDCNRWKETVWAYWGASELDANAIGIVRNA